jgi:hypothetical protein
MRKFIRHPVDIPIEFMISNTRVTKPGLTGNVSVCGLCFKSKECVENDKILTIRIPLINPKFKLHGRVVRCMKRDNQVEIGVEFIDQNDLYATRMIEQICYIKQYKKDVAEQQGKILTDEEAAREWIYQHAAQFPK